MVPIGKNVVLCTSEFVKSIDLMLSVLITRGRKKKKKGKERKGKITPKPKDCKETLGGIGYIYFLDVGRGIMGICICPNSSDCIH